MGDIVQMPHLPDLAKRILRAEAIRSAVAENPKFPPGDEHLICASNLDLILERAKHAEGFDIHKVLANKDVNLAGGCPTDSTKRLTTYRLPQGASESRKASIAKKPRKYLQIACAVAAEVGEPEAVLVAQVFEGCSIGTEHLVDGDWDSENWSRLAILFTSMANAVIRDHDLDEYWRKVRATNGIYDVRAEKFRATPQPLGYLADGWGLACDCVCSDEVAPVPSVPLGRRMQGTPLPGWVNFSADDTVDVEYVFWLEVRLALGPVNDQLSIGPLFEFRTVIEGRMEDSRIVRFDNPHTDTTDVVKRAFIGGEEHSIQGIGLYADALLDAPEFRDGAEHSYFSWSELNPALLRYLFDPAGKETAEIFSPIKRHEGVREQDLPPSRFGRASAASVLHTDLLTGAMEAELGAVCDRLTTQLDVLRAEQDCAIRDAEAEAIARWTTRTATQATVERVDQ